MKLKKILNNLKFDNIISCTHEELEIIREIRNESNIRKNMRTSEKISTQDHMNWFKKLKSSKIHNFYLIRYDSKIVGGLGFNNYDKNLLSGEWAYYVSDKSKFLGLGACIEFKAIEYFFNSYELNSLFCYVLKHNLGVIKLHNKFGFQEISYDEYFKNNRLNNEDLNAIYFTLSKFNWNIVNMKIYDIYFR
tara:strand:+ start:338 stop:910 length:573 start_codon:yes stop_codon:yes gene_type:complete